MAQVVVNLKASERDALRKLARVEFRDPRAQAALIIRAELERLGLLTREPLTTDAAPLGGEPNHATAN